MTIAFTIFGPPATKKTSNRLVRAKGRQFILPSKAYQRWFDNAMSQLPLIIVDLLANQRADLPICSPVHVSALFYRATRRKADLTGLQQALGDWLQAPRFRPARNGAGIIDDDSQIVSWDGSRALYDKANPRIEVEITA